MIIHKKEYSLESQKILKWDSQEYSQKNNLSTRFSFENSRKNYQKGFSWEISTDPQYWNSEKKSREKNFKSFNSKIDLKLNS